MARVHKTSAARYLYCHIPSKLIGNESSNYITEQLMKIKITKLNKSLPMGIQGKLFHGISAHVYEREMWLEAADENK